MALSCLPASWFLYPQENIQDSRFVMRHSLYITWV
jgi:hypothetical protein